MNKYSNHLDYDDLETIIQKARMQRSVAVADAIAGLMAATLSGLSRAVNAVKSGASGPKPRAAANGKPILDASGHR